MSQSRTTYPKNEWPQWQIDLINQIANAMRSYYCLPERFLKNEEQLKLALKDTFNALNEKQSSHKPNTKEEYKVYLDAINKTLGHFDPHLEIEYGKEFIAERKMNGEIVKNKASHSAQFDFGSGPPQQELLKINAFRGAPELNYGFRDTPKDQGVPSNIGYLKIDFLLDPEMGAKETDEKYRVGPNAKRVLDEIMKKMQGKKALIIDLRDAEEGGSPKMVQYIVSFFIKEKNIVINEIDDRLTGTREAYKTLETPYQLFDMPIDILTDKTTFSGREELAYDLQQLNIQLYQRKQVRDRFRVIGEVTRGGAHPEFSFPLLSDSGEINDDVILRIPYACSINPVSGTNWEDQEIKGVQPDHKIKKGEDALVAALEHLKKMISEKETSLNPQSFFNKPEAPSVKSDGASSVDVLRKRGG